MSKHQQSIWCWVDSRGDQTHNCGNWLRSANTWAPLGKKVCGKIHNQTLTNRLQNGCTRHRPSTPGPPFLSSSLLLECQTTTKENEGRPRDHKMMQNNHNYIQNNQKTPKNCHTGETFTSLCTGAIESCISTLVHTCWDVILAAKPLPLASLIHYFDSTNWLPDGWSQ